MLPALVVSGLLLAVRVAGRYARIVGPPTSENNRAAMLLSPPRTLLYEAFVIAPYNVS